MFFELHDEQRIGYKHLTEPDLGRKQTSHVTHIGLFDDVLTFLPNETVDDDCLLIYQDTIDTLPLLFKRIRREDGKYESPRLRLGRRTETSVARAIRQKANLQPDSLNWYLFWFALKSGQPVFVLFNDKSQTYTDIISLGIVLHNDIKGRLHSEDATFSSFLHYFENLTNKAGSDIVEEIETAIQQSSTIPQKHRNFDLARSREFFNQIGKDGETAVNKYFSVLKAKKEIIDYEWVNEDHESGRPYDFCYTDINGTTVYLDVKTANFWFQQKMFFSSQEIAFAISPEYENSEYHVYRVYKNDAGELCLRICTNIRKVFDYIHYHTRSYEPAINRVAKIETIKFSLLPEENELNFGAEIKLA